MFCTRTLIGLSIDEFGIDIAEVRIHSGRPMVERIGQWSFAEKLNPNNVNELGRKFKQFLRTNHFSSKQVIIGIPTKWVVAKEITAPPASSDALAGMLGIQAERAFSLNANELIFDYCGRTSASEKRQVLLVAARRQIVDQIRALATAAGLQVRALTVSALALSKLLFENDPEYRYGLYIQPTYCEFWTQANGSPQSIHHVPLASKNTTEDEYTELLASTIQRLIGFSSQQGHSPPHCVTAYRGVPSDKITNQLNERLRPQVTITNGDMELLPDRLRSTDIANQAQSVAALAVANTAAATDGPAIDFLNPRIGARKKTSRKRITVWASVIVGVCLMALAAVLVDWQADRRDIATYSEQLELMSEDIAAAREVVERISYASSWTSREPVFLNCLRELTLTFPEEPMIWATNLRLSENAGALVGRAVDEESFYEVLDKIKEHKAFSNVQMIHIRNAGRNSKEKEFAVNFEFQGGQ